MKTPPGLDTLHKTIKRLEEDNRKLTEDNRRLRRIELTVRTFAQADYAVQHLVKELDAMTTAEARA